MQIDLSKIIAKLTIEPAQILGINSGRLEIGSIADICVFDPEKSWQSGFPGWSASEIPAVP